MFGRTARVLDGCSHVAAAALGCASGLKGCLDTAVGRLGVDWLQHRRESPTALWCAAIAPDAVTKVAVRAGAANEASGRVVTGNHRVAPARALVNVDAVRPIGVVEALLALTALKRAVDVGARLVRLAAVTGEALVDICHRWRVRRW